VSGSLSAAMLSLAEIKKMVQEMLLKNKAYGLVYTRPLCFFFLE
jgi:hypothetical protein